MKHLQQILATGACALFLCLQSASAQNAAPSLINYQGKLTDASGAALADGQYKVVFGLYSNATTTIAVWRETNQSVSLSGGVFNVALGSVTPLGTDSFGDAARFLQTTIVSGPGITNEQTLLPRQQMASVPYALVAQNATNAANAVKLAGQDPTFYMPAGVVVAYGGTNEPAGWLLCDGREVSRSTYANLYASIGTAHGAGNGSNTFNLPDYRGVFLRGVANIPSVTITAVDAAAETLTLTSHPYRRNGVPVRLTGTLPAPLATNTTYFTIIVDANKVALAATEADANAASPVKINLTGSTSGGVVVQAVDPDAAARRSPTGNSALAGVGSFQADALVAHSHPYAGVTYWDSNANKGDGGSGVQRYYGWGTYTTSATGGNETRPVNAYVNYIIKY